MECGGNDAAFSVRDNHETHEVSGRNDNHEGHDVHEGFWEGNHPPKSCSYAYSYSYSQQGVKTQNGVVAHLAPKARDVECGGIDAAFDVRETTKVLGNHEGHEDHEGFLRGGA